MNWETLTQIDRRHIWHPYAAMPNTQPVYAVARAEGCSIELADGKRLVDGTSSWWDCCRRPSTKCFMPTAARWRWRWR